MKVNRSRCMWCGACVGFCPFKGVTLYETRIMFEDACTECGKCILVCPVGAISEGEE